MKGDLCCRKWPEGHDLGEGLIAYMEWSKMILQEGKKRKYKDYFEKIETYVGEVSFHADNKNSGSFKTCKVWKKYKS